MAKFKNDSELIGKRIKAEPQEPPKTTIDFENSLEGAILNAASSSSLNTGVLESFSTFAESRELEYELIDTMGMDSMVSAAIEMYASDATQSNKDGKIFWVESDDQDVANYVQYLLDKIDFDRNAYKWAYVLTKYGDVYVKLVRDSEFENSYIFGKKKKDNTELKEDVNIIVNRHGDHYADTLDTVRNPGEMFDLVKFGKTIGFIKAPVKVQKDFRSNNELHTYITYKMNKGDVDIYAPTEFVHACLENSFTRSQEDVDIFTVNEDGSDIEESFEVKRGAGILNDGFKTWRQLTLLENSVLLSRITRSSKTRMLQMEVGDMPQNQVANVTSRVKSLLEQKSALEVGSKMSEYVNPGPVENIVILPTKNGKGAITVSELGGDYDPKTLTDLDYWINKFTGSCLKIPKQFLGYTDDNTGFNGGTSLTILNGEYGKLVQKIKDALVKMVTDCINLLLIDKGFPNMINNFVIKMERTVTQKDIDDKSDFSNSLRNISDIMNVLTDLEDKEARLKCIKALLGDVLGNQEINNILQEEIEKLDVEKKDGENPEEKESTEETSPIDFEGIDNSQSSFNPIENTPPSVSEPTEETPSEGETTPVEEPEGSELPSPSDLGVDMTVNPQR